MSVFDPSRASQPDPDAAQSHAGETVFRGQLLTVRVDNVTAADGTRQRFEVVEHPDAVAVVALRLAGAPGEPEVALVRQRRPAIGRETWEIPAGLVEAAERATPQRAAERELREETGCVASEWRLLAHEYPSPGFSTEAIHLYLALGAQPGADESTTSREIAQVAWLPLGQALALTQSGEATDGKTLLGLTLAHAALASTTLPPSSTPTGARSMPLDPTNPPFSRAAPFRDDGAAGAPERDASLKLENLLLEEYNYAGVTGYQAYEDRARMFNLYLLLIGVLASGLGAIYQFGGQGGARVASAVQPLIVLLLIVSGLLGIVFFVMMIQLRAAHRESLITMNTIKEYYLHQFARVAPTARFAFRWQMKTIPNGERLGSVGFLVSYAIAFLGSLSFAGAAYITLGDLNGIGALDSYLDPPWQAALVALLVFALSLFGYVAYYRRVLNKRTEREALKQLVAALDSNLESGEEAQAQ